MRRADGRVHRTRKVLHLMRGQAGQCFWKEDQFGAAQVDGPRKRILGDCDNFFIEYDCLGHDAPRAASRVGLAIP
jgi:hypothetical protein